MSEHTFGLGPDWLGKKANEIARKHGATLVNYTDAQCNCGRGCRPHTCQKSRRHWFSCPNLGHPFDAAVSSSVLADLAAAGIVTP
jgi:hypothetical protein